MVVRRPIRARPIRPVVRSTNAGEATTPADVGLRVSATPSDYRRVFSHPFARYDAYRYGRRGRLPKTAHRLAELVVPVDGETVLDVGGGVGTLALELLRRGASHATVVELSDGYESAAAKLLAQDPLGDRVERRIGDFVTAANLIAPHDVVVLHRVVSSYPDAGALISAAASHTRRCVALTYPRQLAHTRLMIGAVNGLLRLNGSAFRAYVHPFDLMTAAAEREGLQLVTREPQGLLWENALFVRRDR